MSPFLPGCFLYLKEVHRANFEECSRPGQQAQADRPLAILVSGERRNLHTEMLSKLLLGVPARLSDALEPRSDRVKQIVVFLDWHGRCSHDHACPAVARPCSPR